MLPGSEVISRESPPAQLVPADAGTWFVAGLSDRGTVTKPLLVRNIGQFVSNFGPRVSYGALYDALDTFFREGGGKAYVTRVVGPAAVEAKAELADGEAKTLKVAAISPGAWGNELEVDIAEGVAGGTFQVTVEESGEVVEQSGDLADKEALIAWAANSSYVVFTDTGVGADPDVQTVELKAGKDDRENITDEEWFDALELFTAGYGPGQVSAPGRTTEEGHSQLLAHASTFNRVAILDGTDTPTVGTLTAQATAVRNDDNARFGGLFAPWVTVPGVAPGTSRTVAPSAVVCGEIARLAALGVSPNVAAAGENGISNYAIDLSQVAWTDAERETLNDAGVNVLRLHRGAFRTYGFRTPVDGDVDDTWLQLTNARLYMVIAALADAIAEKYVFAQIDGRRHKLSEFNAELTAMLMPFWSQGSLYGETFQEAAIVDTGPQVNTEETIAAREIRAVIAVRMSPFGERVTVEISKVATTEAL